MSLENTTYQPSESLMLRYQDLIRQMLLDLDVAVQERDLSVIEHITHKIAGNAGTYGFSSVGLIASELCQTVRAGNVAAIDGLFSKLSLAARSTILKTND